MPLIAALGLCTAPTAFASGSGGGGSGGGGSSGGGTPACATVALNPLYTFGNGSQRFVVSGNVTNCGTAGAVYMMRASETGTHVDPLCAINTTSYRLPSVAPGASSRVGD